MTVVSGFSPYSDASSEPLPVGLDLLARDVVFGAVALTRMTTTPLAAAACDGLRDGPKGTVGSVVDGDTLILDNGLVVRLIGIQAPHLSLVREGFSDWPKGDDAKAALESIAL